MLALRHLKNYNKAYRWTLLAILCICFLLLGSQELYLKYICKLYLTQFAVYTPPFLQEILLRHCSQFSNMLYRVYYVAFCVLIIYLYFNSSNVSKLALYLFGSILVFTMLLYFLGKTLHIGALHIAAYRVDGLLISPMPIVLLISSLKLILASKASEK